MGWFQDGHPPAWKLGGSPASGPACAPVPADAIFESPWQLPAGFAVQLGIEAEVAVRLRCDLAPDADMAAVWAAIDCLYPCIELCDIRLDAQQPLPASVQRADQQFNRALILGPALRVLARPDWSALRLAVQDDGHEIFRGEGCHPYGNPLHSLPWLARHAAEHWDGLRAGDLIATGSWSGIHWAQPGARVRVELDEFGSVEMRL
ncbi:MAG: hydratase [Candidatus Dactylopiibacterium carminicum]|uniref:Hydratase n=2 Tax=Candidatus Dactylopiibacterium carminicum TaxID=857335 RepID=A0A272EVR3_9RHOO|nr:hydratase [Candidatus Dactylopiibacterium carminicum]PAS94201.1 MAG: hydratase [Candidatus Dactylopiibacterium carminicum]PAS96790.1 MAG: hydratase [Candidatus Dactylopiibacterium carminicum]